MEPKRKVPVSSKSILNVSRGIYNDLYFTVKSYNFDEYFVVTFDPKNDMYTLEMELNIGLEGFNTKRSREFNKVEYETLTKVLDVTDEFRIEFDLETEDFVIKFIF